MTLPSFDPQQACIIIQVRNGFGWMPVTDYKSLPHGVQRRIRILAFTPTEELAKELFDYLPDDWEHHVFHYNPRTGETRDFPNA